MADNEAFQVTLGDFSGPLDLLCHLVESRSMDISSIKLTDVLSQYVTYMLTAKKATLPELAEFFYMASSLLLGKVRSLFPSMAADDEEYSHEDEDLTADDEGMDEERLALMLERFRPYRRATALLARMKDERERSFVRITDESEQPWFDIGDLYALSARWWSLLESHMGQRRQRTERGFMLDVPDAVPEEVLVEHRMEEIAEELSVQGSMNLKELLCTFRTGGLIVTLLAMLELSRLGRLRIIQTEALGDIEIEAA